MLGINDPWIWSAYLLCIISAAICVVYGIMNWNKGAEHEKEDIKEEQAWEEEEEEIEEALGGA